MNTVFLIAVGLAACFVLLLVGLAVRSLFRRGESEIGGWEMRGSGRRLSAVARSTIAEGLRMRLAAAFVVAVVVAIPWFAWTGTGDGTIKGRVQMFISYSFGFAGFLLSLLTIVLSTRSLSAEITGRQIFGLASKPIPRWQIVVGKWLGVTVLNAALLAFAGAASYVGVRGLVWASQKRLHGELVTRGGLTPAQADKCIAAVNHVRGPGGPGDASPIIPAMADALGWSNEQVKELLLTLPEATRLDLRRLDELRRQVLVARASLRPETPDVTEQVEQRFAELKKAGDLPKDWSEDRTRYELRLVFEDAARRVPAHKAARWSLKGPPPVEGRDFLLSVRYQITGFFAMQPMPDGTVIPDSTIIGAWCVGDPTSANAYWWPEPVVPKPVNTYVEFEVPVRAVDPDGTVQLEYDNIDPRRVAAQFARDGVEVLYTVGGFEGNVMRGAAVMLLRLLIIAALGVFFSTFCTAPVAALVTLTLFAAASAGGFVYESLSLTPDQFTEYPTFADSLRKASADALFSILSLGDVAAADRLIEGRTVSWTELGGEALTGLGKTALFLALGVAVFRRRELAAVIV